jgi:hypothetical protein
MYRCNHCSNASSVTHKHSVAVQTHIRLPPAVRSYIRKTLTNQPRKCRSDTIMARMLC